MFNNSCWAFFKTENLSFKQKCLQKQHQREIRWWRRIFVLNRKKRYKGTNGRERKEKEVNEEENEKRKERETGRRRDLQARKRISWISGASHPWHAWWICNWERQLLLSSLSFLLIFPSSLLFSNNLLRLTQVYFYVMHISHIMIIRVEWNVAKHKQRGPRP